MGRELSPPIIFTDENGGDRSFTDLDALRDFIDAERNSWGFLVEKTETGNSQLTSRARWPIERLNALRSVIEEYSSGGNNEGNLREHVDMTFSTVRNGIPVSNTPRWLALKGLAEGLPRDAFLSAAITILRRWDESIGAPRLSEDAQWLGIVAAANYRLGYTSTAAKAHTDALDQLRAQYATLLSEERASFSRQLAEREEALQKFTAEGDALLAIHADESEEIRKREGDRFRLTLESHNTNHATAKLQWDNTHNAFIEQMRLKASTAYWSDKRIAHRKRAKMWGAIAGIYAVLATLTMVLGIDSEYVRLMEMTETTPLGAYVALAARGVVISVVVFWVGRILVRMFLSELHLAMDAYERSTMVSTYLALTQDGKIDEKERALVLAPLFRPTADGWVKDDASTDSNFANVLSMLKGKP